MNNEKIGKNKQAEIFKITITGLLLAVALAVSFIELNNSGIFYKIQFFELLVFIFAITIVGTYYSLLIAMIEPLLHLLLHQDGHAEDLIVMPVITNAILVLSYSYIYYYLFKLSKPVTNYKADILKKTIAGLILIIINVLVITAAKIIGYLVIYPKDFKKIINYLKDLIFIINFVTYTILYVVFILSQKYLKRFNFKLKS